MKKIHVLCALVVVLLAFACKPAGTDAGTTANADSTAAAPQQPVANVEVKLVCRELRSADEDMPLSELSLQIGSKTIPVDSINTCEELTRDMWDNFHIPADAKMATGGWWAGAGDYFYLKIDGGDAVVMYGWAAEEANEEDMYQYEEVKRAKIQ